MADKTMFNNSDREPRKEVDVLFPAWHRDVLLAREQRIADGTSRFLDIDYAKAAVHAQVK